MATEVALVELDRTGVPPATAVAADPVEGNSVPNARGLHLVLENTDAASHVVTFSTPVTVSTYEVADPTVTLAAGEILHLAGFPPGVFGNDLVLTADAATVMVSAYLVQ